jgi:hypothetical protein
MIGLEVRSLADDAFVAAVEAVRGGGRLGPSETVADGTNTVGSVYSFLVIHGTSGRTLVDDTIDHALCRYQNLLRRLAD